MTSKIQRMTEILALLLITCGGVSVHSVILSYIPFTVPGNQPRKMAEDNDYVLDKSLWLRCFSCSVPQQNISKCDNNSLA